ncbi:MAG: L-dopachrome tautomerase-related protein [Planctomycetota bacterium]
MKIPCPRATPALASALLLLAGCAGSGAETDDGPMPPEGAPLDLVAESPRQWTGVAASPGGRLFVCFPRWSDDVPISVAELVDGQAVPFPDEAWNAWAPGDDPSRAFCCVQSVHVDGDGRLWILDAGNPGFRGVIDGAPKLLEVDLGRNEIVGTYPFSDVVRPESYLNDVRVDTERGVAFLTDSGRPGLVVLDTVSGRSRRVLDGHASTTAEDITLTIEGEAWLRDGATPKVHSDGIALTPDRSEIYFQALTGRTLYRVPTRVLRDFTLTDARIEQSVKRVLVGGACDGMAFDASGALYLSSIEENAVHRVSMAGQRELVARDARLSWPDSFAVGPDGWIYVTSAQIHLGAAPMAPYRLWRFRADAR